MDMKRFFLYAIVIAALALAGCGGNGGGTATTPDDMGPDPAAQLSALIGALGQAGLTVTADSTAADIMAQLTAMSGQCEGSSTCDDSHRIGPDGDGRRR